MTRMFSSLLIPLVLLSAAFGLLHYTGLGGTGIQAGGLPASIHYIPYIVAVTGMALSWRFNRGQTFYVLAVLALSYWGLLFSLQEAHIQTALAKNIYAAVGVLVPINLVLFSLFRERGILKTRDWMRLGVVLLQLTLLGVAFTSNPGNITGLLHHKFIHHPLLAITPLPQPALLALLAAFLFLFTGLVIKRNIIDGALLGALLTIGLALHLQGDAFTTTVLLTTAGLMVVVAVIQHSYRMAYVDELTELPSRRALMEKLKSLGKRYVIAMLDIDHFKQVNDKYGHDTGDQVLRFIAAQMKSLDGNGKAYRYGGEEFSLVFTSKRLDEVVPLLEALRRDIADSPFMLRGKRRPRKKPRKWFRSSGSGKLRVTVSIGVAERSLDDTSPADVIKTADKVLYRAKGNGRNCVCFK